MNYKEVYVDFDILSCYTIHAQMMTDMLCHACIKCIMPSNEYTLSQAHVRLNLIISF